jgi:hypothetical protein
MMTPMSDSPEITPDALPFQPRCLSIDLEVGLRSGRIRQLAALRGDSGESLRFDGGDLAARSAVSMRWPMAAASCSGTISSTSTGHTLPRPSLGCACWRCR